MPAKLQNALPLFINVIIQECQVVSDLLHNLTQVKAKEICLAEWTLHFIKNTFLTQKYYCEVCMLALLQQKINCLS